MPKIAMDNTALNAVELPRYIRPSSICRNDTSITIRTGTLRFGLTADRKSDAGSPLSRAKAHAVRLVEVTQAALAATATRLIHNARIDAPAEDSVTFRNSCMNGKPIFDCRSPSRFPRAKSSTIVYIRPIIPLITTLPTIARGTFREGLGSSSLR